MRIYRVLHIVKLAADIDAYKLFQTDKITAGARNEPEYTSYEAVKERNYVCAIELQRKFKLCLNLNLYENLREFYGNF